MHAHTLAPRHSSRHPPNPICVSHLNRYTLRYNSKIILIHSFIQFSYHDEPRTWSTLHETSWTVVNSILFARKNFFFPNLNGDEKFESRSHTSSFTIVFERWENGRMKSANLVEKCWFGFCQLEGKNKSESRENKNHFAALWRLRWMIRLRAIDGRYGTGLSRWGALLHATLTPISSVFLSVPWWLVHHHCLVNPRHQFSESEIITIW